MCKILHHLPFALCCKVLLCEALHNGLLSSHLPFAHQAPTHTFLNVESPSQSLAFMLLCPQLLARWQLRILWFSENSQVIVANMASQLLITLLLSSVNLSQPSIFFTR